jgi:hypothetical protein
MSALVDCLAKLGRLARDMGDCIEAVDVNPLLVLPGRGGASALDALVVLRPPPKAERTAGAAREDSRGSEETI